MEQGYKYVWLNLNTGEFSNSWLQEDQDLIEICNVDIAKAVAEGWKLIKFQCVNDDTFVFTKHMKLRK